MKPKIFYVYGIFYPDGTIFYVGKGTAFRVRDHLKQIYLLVKDSFYNRILTRVYKKIRNSGGTPLVKILFRTLDEVEALSKERELIKKIGRRNNNTGPLMNLNDGGLGQEGFSHSEETKLKLSESKKGAVAWNKGIPADPKRMKRMHDKWRGSKHTEESLEKIRIASQRQRNPEYREKMRQITLRFWSNPDNRMKMQEIRRAKKRHQNVSLYCEEES